MLAPFELAKAVPLPKPDANKYTRGKCVLLVGSKPYPGAACLSSWASQYVGAGYTEVFTAAENRFILQIWRPSLVVRSFEECVPSRLISPDHPGAVVMGSGIDANDTHAKKLCLRLLKKIAHPVLLDGGALSFAAQQEGRKALKKRGEKMRTTVLTPHAGEAARLAEPFGISLEEPEKAAKKLARAL